MILAPNEGLLALKKTEYFLPNVPIGLLTPVMFPIEMTNVGSVSVSYNVDIVEDKTKAGSSTTLSKFKIFEVHNSQGTVNQGERNYLFCKFRPLESITYKFLLKLKMFDMFKTIDTVDIKVEGCGFLSHIQKPQKELTEKIPMQRSSGSLFGSQVFFSIEELDFGEILPGTSEHRIIILYNISPNRKLSFKIKETKLPCLDTLISDPITGEVEPQQFTEIKLTLISHQIPSVYEGELECQIEWKGIQPQSSEKPISKDTTGFVVEKETLFLRIKKKSKLTELKEEEIVEVKSNETNISMHAFEVILRTVIQEILNDPELDETIQKIDDQPVTLFYKFDKENPVSIDALNESLEGLQPKAPAYNFQKDIRSLFMLNEFTDLVDEVIENTFFNIIQETTRKEGDLLKTSKTFLTHKP